MTAPERLETGTLAEVAYGKLRRDIINGVFAPGQPLRLELLKQRYGLSFSPLREALNRLQAERLVDSGRGFSVAPLSVEEMWDVTETRILIECQALRRSIENGDDHWETAIVAAFHALDLQVRRTRMSGRPRNEDDEAALESRHHDFHHALIAGCRSRRLLDLADQLYVETERYRRPTLTGDTNSAVARDVPEEHRQIMQAVLARHTDVAADLLASHYRKTSETVEAMLPLKAIAV